MAKTTVDFLNSSFDGKSISAKHLQHIPKMMDCENWPKVEFLGRVACEFKFSKIDGGLIRYLGKLYYVNMNQIKVLSGMYKWDLKKQISVIKDA